jgi:hypothetical protein
MEVSTKHSKGPVVPPFPLFHIFCAPTVIMRSFRVPLPQILILIHLPLPQYLRRPLSNGNISGIAPCISALSAWAPCRWRRWYVHWWLRSGGGWSRSRRDRRWGQSVCMTILTLWFVSFTVSFCFISCSSIRTSCHVISPTLHQYLAVFIGTSVCFSLSVCFSCAYIEMQTVLFSHREVISNKNQIALRSRITTSSRLLHGYCMVACSILFNYDVGSRFVWSSAGYFIWVSPLDRIIMLWLLWLDTPSMVLKQVLADVLHSTQFKRRLWSLWHSVFPCASYGQISVLLMLPITLLTTDPMYTWRLSGATFEKNRCSKTRHIIALSICIMSEPQNQRLQVDQTSTLGASYTPPAGPQQFKVPTTWAPLRLRHTQVYAVTLRSKLQMLSVIIIIIIDGEKCWICLRGGE